MTTQLDAQIDVYHPRPVLNSHETVPYDAACPSCDRDAKWTATRQQWSDSGHDWPPLLYVDCEVCGQIGPVFPPRELPPLEESGEVLVG